MKKYSILIFYALLVQYTFGQKPKAIPPKVHDIIFPAYKPTRITEVNCSINYPRPPACGNFIRNINFTPVSPVDPVYPINLNQVPEWGPSSGTPNIIDVINLSGGTGVSPLVPPAPATGFAFAGYYSLGNGDNGVDGIAQKIPNLRIGNKYLLSFFEANATFPNVVGSIKFKIELLHCHLFTTFPQTYAEPIFPPLSDHQTIYCEINPTNPNWQKRLINFTANSDYDVIMITPTFAGVPSSPPNIYFFGGFNFAYPELIDVTNISAGAAPTPTAGNCTVTIGPATPNCSVNGAVFNWISPTGTVIPAPANQQIQVNTSIPANVGTWTLQMTVPSSITSNNTCSNNGGVQASVAVGACPSGLWPKAYDVYDGVGPITKNNMGDILFSSAAFINNSTLYNHSGFFPPLNQTYTTTFHYTTNGITNWLTNDAPGFTFNSGVVAMTSGSYASNYYYVNANNGNIVNMPFTISSQEGIIAELSNGDIVTIKQNSELCIHTLSGGVNPQNVFINNGYWKYNRANNNLIEVTINPFGVSYYRVYHYNGSVFQLITNTAMPTIIYYSQHVAIDNSGKYYYYDINGTLNYYDPVTNANYTANIQGLVNHNLISLNCYDLYTSNMVFVFNQSNNYIYLLNLAAQNSKKILTNNLNLPINYNYEGDNIYFAGSYYGQAQIGNQTIPQLNQTSVPTFITKLSLQNDFTNFVSTPSANPNSVSFTGNNPSSKTISDDNFGGNKIIQSGDKAAINVSNIAALDIYNQLGQLMQRTSKPQQIKEVLSNGNLNSITASKGLYFIRITYKNNTNETIKRFLN